MFVQEDDFRYVLGSQWINKVEVLYNILSLHTNFITKVLLIWDNRGVMGYGLTVNGVNFKIDLCLGE